MAVMFEALKLNNVEKVSSLLSNGFDMQRFLTIPRLENLYNADREPTHTLSYIVRDVTTTDAGYKYILPHIGLAMEKLMGGAYESHYSNEEFRTRYFASKIEYKSRESHSTMANLKKGVTTNGGNDPSDFKYPFSDLFIWAVLTKRQQIALLLWKYGPEALTKALVAVRLYKFLSYEASDDSLDQDVCEDFQRNAREFERLALELIEQCFRKDHERTSYLLTYELQYWGKQTNLSLAVMAYHKEFLAHTCCQFLLSDLWLGGLIIRRYVTLKIIGCILFPAFILTLNFKTKQELSQQAQRADELDVEKSEMESGSGKEKNSQNLYEKLRLKSPPPSIRKNTLDSCNIDLPNVGKVDNSTSNSVDRKLTPTAKDVASTYRYNKRRLGFGQTEIPLNAAKKFYEFYMAPQTTFWIWTIGYFVFLATFTVTVLTNIPISPKWQEWYIMAYVGTFACETIRRILILEGRNFCLKVRLYFNRTWSKLYALAVLCCFVAIALRFVDGMRSYARICYACDIVFWYLLLLDLMSVDFQIGVYVLMLKKMIIGMFQVLSILAVVLLSFGIVRQSIHYAHDDWNWQMARNVVYKPYFMLYGEVYTEEIDTCDDQNVGCDVPGYWITPIYLAMFMMISNILIINLMIAVFNHIFADINAKSQTVWRFYRYWVVLDYEYKPFLPPPLIALYHIYYVLKLLFRRKKHGRWFDYALKHMLTCDEVELLYNELEKECVKNLNINPEAGQSFTVDDKLRRANEKLELLSKKLDALLNQCQTMQATLDQRQAEIVQNLKPAKSADEEK